MSEAECHRYEHRSRLPSAFAALLLPLPSGTRANLVSVAAGRPISPIALARSALRVTVTACSCRHVRGCHHGLAHGVVNVGPVGWARSFRRASGNNLPDGHQPLIGGSVCCHGVLLRLLALGVRDRPTRALILAKSSSVGWVWVSLHQSARSWSSDGRYVAPVVGLVA